MIYKERISHDNEEASVSRFARTPNRSASCVNRDDTGSPKTALYGGATRARVSSQAWKHAIRMMFREMLAPEQLGQRTKRIVGMVEEKIRALSPEADARKLAADVLTNAGLPLNAKNLDKGTDALFFMSNAQAEALARIAVEEPEKLKDKDACKSALASAPSVDIALFGRMVASTPSLGVDASAQVAHAISTHAVRNEFDYFTAVDDRAPEDTAGAGHLARWSSILPHCIGMPAWTYWNLQR